MDRAERGQQELKQRFADWLAERLAERRDVTTMELAAEVGVLDGDVEDWLAGRAMPVGGRRARSSACAGIPPARGERAYSGLNPGPSGRR
jgi:hypothetical protein